jgi:hypothetical protein
MSGTLKVTTLQDGASATANMVFDTSGNTTAGGTVAMASSFKRNRIINGNMLIDQRNAGASVTPTVDPTYTLDRWQFSLSAASKFSAQQSSTAPAGFINSALITSLSAYSVPAGGYFMFNQPVEGLNVSDLGWGTASAQTVTLSFWVRSSLTGTFGGAFQNSANSRSYPFSYTISVANTWEQKSVTVAGDTSGTWLTTNGVGVMVRFGLGVGSTYSNTAGAWAAGNYSAPTGATSVVGTNGATFYITGVQLEVGTKATPYEMQIYSDQLAQCQRYYYKLTPGASLPWLAAATQNSNAYASVSFPVEMRTAPTVGDSAPTKVTSSPSGNQIAVFQSGYQTISGTVTVTSPNTRMAQLFIGSIGGVAAGQGVTVDIGSGYYLTASAEL